MSDRIGRGFSLVMELDEPARLGELMARLGVPQAKQRIGSALRSLDYIHFARFLPLWEHGLLLIVTEFDGEMEDYVLDFAAVLNDEFSLILSYMKGRPALPVREHPVEFIDYVRRHTRPLDPALPAHDDPFCAYPGRTALEIAGVARAKRLPPPPPRELPPRAVPRDDVQANIVRGYRASRARHVGFVFPPDNVQARGVLDRLLVTVTREDQAAGRASCVVLGLTHAGLQALGLPQPLLDRFPQAFREGPRLRAARLGDTGRNDALHWDFAGAPGGNPVVVHGMVSVYIRHDVADPAAALGDATRRVLEPFGDAESLSLAPDAAALDGGPGVVHFGYLDGIAQPRIDLDGTGAEGLVAAGDLLLGSAYRNSRGGCHSGSLPDALADNACYAALRVIEQDVAAFETLLAHAQAERQVPKETLAAKLMGRWRNGTPLATHPNGPAEDAPNMPGSELDDFDYAGRADQADDREGRICPFGAHIRRLNPRGGMVVGVPWGRRVVRRGMPYGPRFDPDAPPDGESRGLVGMFLCADLESQFEFIQHVWANEDLSAPGLRDSQDPFVGAREHATPFRFRPREDEAEITVMVPPLTRLRGSVYLFLPGFGGLRWLAGAGWLAPGG